MVAVIPMQDSLDLGNEARLNFPGRAGCNWQYRYTESMLTEPNRLREMTELYGRMPKQVEEKPHREIEVEEA
jgi:4-alpha-glucanotransferase